MLLVALFLAIYSFIISAYLIPGTFFCTSAVKKQQKNMVCVFGDITDIDVEQIRGILHSKHIGTAARKHVKLSVLRGTLRRCLNTIIGDRQTKISIWKKKTSFQEGNQLFTWALFHSCVTNHKRLRPIIQSPHVCWFNSYRRRFPLTSIIQNHNLYPIDCPIDFHIKIPCIS